MAQQFLLEGRDLDELARQAVATYGRGARIVRAEKVLDPGVAGFLGRRHLEVTVEVPDADGPPTPLPAPSRAGVHALGDRAGILALLQSADRAEDDVNPRHGTAPLGASGPSAPSGSSGPVVPAHTDPVSTQSPGVAELLSRLGEDRASRGVPVPLSAPGDHVVVLGLGSTARAVATTMATGMASGTAGAAAATVAATGAGGYALHVAGVADPDDAGHPRLDTRWAVAEARALAVEARATVLTAYALGSPTGELLDAEQMALLGADQVWVVVDARHKPDETQEWVAHVRKAIEVHALAVVGAGDSRSAHTVNRLGLPLGWLDGQPAPRTAL